MMLLSNTQAEPGDYPEEFIFTNSIIRKVSPSIAFYKTKLRLVIEYI